MKRNILCMLAAIMFTVVLFTGCTAGNAGSSPDASAQASAPVPEPASSAASDGGNEQSIGIDGESEAIVQGLVDEIQPQISNMEEIFGGIFTIRIEARGEAVVYTYTYTEDVGDVETVRAGIEESLPSQEANFIAIVDVMKNAGVKSPSVIIEYYNSDGTEIYSTQFK